MNCTAQDTVRRLSSLKIKSRAGTIGVVAIGSSSTAGDGASSVATTYPSVLQRLLSGHPEISAYVVHNRGLSGDTLPGTEARLTRDVLDLNPGLVLLQIGTNDALQDRSGTAIPAFKDRLRSVITRIGAISAVVLINGQHYPTEPASHVAYQNAISEVATHQDVALFDRYAMMVSWAESGRYKFSDMLSSDHFHPNDFTYRCMAEVLSDAALTSTRRYNTRPVGVSVEVEV
jgi:acyl-CoA thioesterase-1